jgi:hypothetical protein
MNLFFDTILGRTVLALMLLCISYTNQMLGAVATLFAIMLFACSYSYTENFDNISPISPMTPTSPMADNTETDTLDNTKYIVAEGFDILGTERNIQRGKKSNTIMVNEDMRKSENVDPYDGWHNQSYFTSIS